MHHREHDAVGWARGWCAAGVAAMAGVQTGGATEVICCRMATHSMRNYSPAVAFCITSPAEKAVERNSRRWATVYPRFLTSRACAFTARRYAGLFAMAFDILLLSPVIKRPRGCSRS